MKKVSSEKRILLKRRQVAKYKKELHHSNYLNQSIIKFGKTYDEYAQIDKNYQENRYKFKKKLYRNYTYEGKPTVVVIDGDFGLENRSNLHYFLEKPQKL